MASCKSDTVGVPVITLDGGEGTGRGSEGGSGDSKSD